MKKFVPLTMVALLVATPLLARQHSSGNISLSTTTLSFNGSSGNVSSQPLTITATGQRSVTIQKISFSNGTFSNFVCIPARHAFPRDRALTVKVTAKPQSTAQTGTLTVTSTANDPTVSLSETAISKATSHSVSLTWHAPSSSSDPVDSYQVDRAASGSTQYSTVGTTVASSTAFTDNSVTSGHTYVYEVRSVDESGRTSNPSNTITMTIP